MHVIVLVRKHQHKSILNVDFLKVFVTKSLQYSSLNIYTYVVNLGVPCLGYHPIRRIKVWYIDISIDVLSSKAFSSLKSVVINVCMAQGRP